MRRLFEKGKFVKGIKFCGMFVCSSLYMGEGKIGFLLLLLFLGFKGGFGGYLGFIWGI